MELWSNLIADLGMRIVDFKLKSLTCNLLFQSEIRNAKSEIRNPKCEMRNAKFPSLQHSNTPMLQNTSSVLYEYYGIFEAIKVK